MLTSKTILLIADRAVYIYAKAGKKYCLVDTLAYGDEDFNAQILKSLIYKCKSAPVLIVNDMVEQQYRKETISKAAISSLDQKNIIKRKVNVAFPNQPFRASYKLKRKGKRNKQQKKSDDYIFAALPQSEEMQKVIRALKISGLRVLGVCLLPVEASGMVNVLAEKLSTPQKTSTKWNVFISQHKSGDLRQIVTNDGNLALTRMTAISNKAADPETWLKQANQEIRATMSYLSRFGYASDEGINLIVLAEEDYAEQLKQGLSDDISLHCLSNAEVAKRMSIDIDSNHEAHEADPLHIAWIAKKAKYTLSLTSAQLNAFAAPRQKAFYGSILLGLVSLGLAYLLFSEGEKLSNVSNNIEQSQRQKAIAQEEYDVALQKQKDLGFDAALIQGAAIVHEELEENNYPLTDMITSLGEVLMRSTRPTSVRPIKIEVKKQDTGNQNQAFSFANVMGDGSSAQYETSIEMLYPATTDIDKGNAEILALKDMLASKLQGFDVKVEKLLKDYEYTQDLVVETGESMDQNQTQQDFTAIVKVRGPFLKQENDQTMGGSF